MKKRKEKKKGSGFRKGFTIYILALVALFLAALVVLWVFLARFQSKKDAEAAEIAAQEAAAAHALAVERAPQLAFEDFVAGTTAEYWQEQWFAANPKSFDDPQQVTEKMQELFFAEDVACYKDESYSEEAPVYLIRNSEMPLARVKVSGTDVDWTASEVTLLVEGQAEVSVEVPAGCTVYCNGQVLGEEYTVDDVSYFEFEEYEDDLVNPLMWTTYTVSGQLFAPTLTAEAPADRNLHTAEDGSFSYVLPAQDAEPYQEEAEEFVKTLLHYYMQGANNTQGNMWAALQCVVHNSQAYTLIYDTYNGVTWDTPYPDATYEATAGDVTIWADNCVSLDVAYHSEGTAQGHTNVADGVYRIYFMDMGDGFGIYGLSYAE